MIEPNKYDIQTASILIDTAKAELDRKIIAELPEQTKRLAFYQGFCVVVLGVLFYLFDNHFFQGWRLWLAVLPIEELFRLIREEVAATGGK